MKTQHAHTKAAITAYTGSKPIAFLFKALIAIILLISAFTIASKAQCNNAPTLVFHSPVLTSGVDGQIGAIYRFAEVLPGVDADIEVMDIVGGATLYNIDDSTGIGYYDAFQPYVGAAPNATSYIDWKITFKVAGTSTDTVLACIAVTGVDVDGDNSALQEFIEAATPGSIAVDPNTILSVSFDGTRSKAVSLINNIPLIDTAHREAMFQMNFTNISTLLYRNGAISNYGSQEIRQTCIYFKPFFDVSLYSLLPVKLMSFSARPSGKGTVINWSASGEQDTKNYTVQKSADGTHWKNIGMVPTAAAAASNNYFITDYENNTVVTYYRLKQTNINNQSIYSTILRVNPGAVSNTGFSNNTIFTNVVNLQVASPVNDSYQVEIYSLAGSKIKQQQNNVYAGVSTAVIEMPAAMPSGIYLMTVKNNKGQQVYNSKIVKN